MILTRRAMFYRIHNLYLKFIQDYWKLILSLTQPTKKHQSFFWTVNADMFSGFHETIYIVPYFSSCWSAKTIYYWSGCVNFYICWYFVTTTWWWEAMSSSFPFTQIWHYGDQLWGTWQGIISYSLFLCTMMIFPRRLSSSNHYIPSSQKPHLFPEFSYAKQTTRDIDYNTR